MDTKTKRILAEAPGAPRCARRKRRLDLGDVTRLRLAALIGLILLGCSVLLYRCWPRPIDIAANILTDQSIAVGGSVRRFRLVVPHSLPADSAPVVFAFHGVGDSVESMATYSKLDRLAAANGFLLVYRAAARSTWATVEVDPDDLDRNEDLRFFDALLEDLAKRFKIDRHRIYLVGMSNGASFAQLVAFARPRVAAVVAHSGARPRALPRAPHSFPVLLVVGGGDPAFNAMHSSAAAYVQDGHVTRFISVAGLGHEWSPAHNAEIWAFLSKHESGE